MKNLKRISSLLLSVMLGVAMASAVVPNMMKKVDEKEIASSKKCRKRNVLPN